MADKYKNSRIPEDLNKKPLITSEVFMDGIPVEYNDKMNSYHLVEPKKRGRKPKVSSEVETPLVEEMTNTGDEFIQKELTKFNIADAIIAQWKEQYGTLTISDPNNKEQYEAVNQARVFIKKKRIDIEKRGKELRSNAIKFQKAVISEEQRLIGLIDPLETYLESEKQRIDDIKTEQKRLRDEAEQIILQERAVNLVKMEMQFTGDAYELGEIRISVMSIKTADNFTWNALIAGVEKRFKEQEEFRLEQERQKELEAAELKKIAEDNLAKQEALNKQAQDLANRQKAIEEAEAKQKFEAERLIQEREQVEKNKILAEKETQRKVIDELVKSRKSQLFQLGFSQQNNLLLFKELSISEEVIKTSNEGEWLTIMDITRTKVDSIKAELEKQRLAEIERIKEESATRERVRIEKESAEKQRQENETKDKLERERLLAEAETKRLAEQVPDLDKLNIYLKSVAAIPMPEFSTQPFQDYVVTITTTKNQFLTHIFKNKPL